MKPYEIRITKQARKDIDKLTPKLKQKLRDVLIEIITENPYEGKRILGDLEGSYSYRLSYKDRIVYSIDEKKKIVYIERARTHYGE
ncbi:MAG: type II toxin-antitoxin system RelE/ParE family toxin [Desulfobacterales bacterium]